MGERLAAHLVSLAPPQFARVASAVLGPPPHGTRDLAERRVAERLLDPAWVESTLLRLGPDAAAAIAAVARAGVPVLRRDVTALVAGHDIDPVDLLEEHGLLMPVRTGRGMPTHIAVPPGVDEIILARLIVSDGASPGRGPAFAGARRRFELALMLAVVGQHPPRLTHSGRLHAGDLNRLATHLAPLGLRPTVIEARLSAWTDLGVAQVRDSALHPIRSAYDDVPRLHLALALAELAAPSAMEGTLRIVGRILASGGTLSMHAAIDAAQATLLRDRADEEAGSQRGARSELLEVVRTLVALEAIVLQDRDGHPIAVDEHAPVPAGGGEPVLALEPNVAAALCGEPAPTPSFTKGHVQSSFEVVADSGCDPNLVARIALWSELTRADRAAVLRLERATVFRAKALGFELDRLLEDLAALGGQSVPSNVLTLLRDWFNSAPPTTAKPPMGELPDVERLCDEARAALMPGAI